MNDIFSIINRRNLPMLPTNINIENWSQIRKEMLDILCSEEYGIIPEFNFRFEVKKKEVTNFAAQKAVIEDLEMTIFSEFGKFSFPFKLTLPIKSSKNRLFIFLNFRPDVPDKFFPAEEIIDRDFATASVFYQDIAADIDDGFENGLDFLLRNAAKNKGVAKNQLPGKIAVWAWASSRILDYMLTREEIDSSKVSVVGHSRLGKTALLAGALDDRFYCAVSNESGCSGAALSRKNGGETIKAITDNFPYWFCEKYASYADNEESLPFDQHWLLSCIAPRLVCVGTALLDEWADTPAQYESCVVASQTWQKLGKTGLVSQKSDCEVGDKFFDGSIEFHLRDGSHYFSREDWNIYIDFLNQKDLL